MASATKWAIAVTYVLAVIIIGLTQSGTIGKPAGTRNVPSHFTVDGITFAIWAVVYLQGAVLAWAQFNPSEASEALLSKPSAVTALDTRAWILLVWVFNCLWPLANAFEYDRAALVLIVLYLVALIFVCLALRTKAATSAFQWWTLMAPNTLHCGWLTAANVLSLYDFAGSLGWRDAEGINGSAMGAAVISVVIAGVASYFAALEWEVAYGAAVAWALTGVYRGQVTPAAGTSEGVAGAALGGALVVVAAIFVGLYSLNKRPAPPGLPFQLLNKA